MMKLITQIIKDEEQKYGTIGGGRMTEQEAIKRIKECRNTPNFQPYSYMNEALDMAIKALQEIQQYRAIGTVEECREAREKWRAVKAIKINDSNFEYQCPKCHFKLEIGYKHCISCGQLLKYSNEIGVKKMNDLIKRSDVLETLESVFKKYNIAYGQEYGGFAEAVPESIRNIPTACNMDKVEEQLEEEYANSVRMLNEHRGTGFEFAEQVRCGSYKKALEIVKAEMKIQMDKKGVQNE